MGEDSGSSGARATGQDDMGHDGGKPERIMLSTANGPVACVTGLECSVEYLVILLIATRG